MVNYEEENGAALAKFAHVCTIIITAAAIVAVIVGIMIYAKLGPVVTGVAELRDKAEANAEVLAKTSEFAQAAAPDYNLAVGFFAPEAEKEPPLADSNVVKAGKATSVEFRVYNVAPPAEKQPKEEPAAGEEAKAPAEEKPAPAPAPRRAEGVSVTVAFPADVDVAAVAAAGATVRKFPRAGGTLVAIDWSAARPLHPDTYFGFRARVKAKKKGDYELAVVADANNPFAAAPSFTGKLRLVAN